jgi:uncharacterized Zn finger protein (UPF0148 family)
MGVEHAETARIAGGALAGSLTVQILRRGSMPDIHCRTCDATFFRPLSPHRGMLCPQCYTAGELVSVSADRSSQLATLQRKTTAAPRARRPAAPSNGAGQR